MQAIPENPASFSPPAAPFFRVTVHGLAFANRARHLEQLEPGEELVMIPDPPVGTVEQVWIHLPSGDPVGHLPDEIGSWLVPWLRNGGRVRARVLKVGDASVPSWRRLLLEVTCLA